MYSRAYETPVEPRTGLARYFEFYNTRRRHSAQDRRTLDADFDSATYLVSSHLKAVVKNQPIFVILQAKPVIYLPQEDIQQTP